MKNRRKSKQRRTPPEQRTRIIEQFERSGLTRRAYSKQFGIPLSTLGKWLKDSRNSNNLPSPMLFQEIAVPAVTTDFAKPWAMELIGPTGIMVRCRDSLSVQETSILLRGLPC
jgi:hypothetical protein